MLKEKKIKVATVFSGIGAPEQALKRLNIDYDLVFACDNGERLIDIDYEKEFERIKSLTNANEKQKYVDELYKNKTRKTNFVRPSYLANYDPNYYFEDIKLLDGTDFNKKIDLFIGGSPCQSFSIAGRRGGFEDTRGTLFYEFARLVKEIEPKVFIYENVFGVLNHDKGKTWETMQNVFNELGYEYKFQVLNAKDYGIPQSRRRIFVVGFKNKAKMKNFEFPKPEPLEYKVQDFLEENCAIGSLQSVDGKLVKINGKKGNPDEKYYLSEKLKKYCLSPGTKNFYHPNIEIDREVAMSILSTVGNSHRASVNNYYTTNGKVRALTERECLRLMGFPDSFKIAVSKMQMLKQAGNSIVVDVMIKIIEEIIKAQEWNLKKVQNDKYKVVSLFSGIGGLDLGFEQAGFELVWANDMDKYAVETYKANVNNNIVCNDIRIAKKDIPNHDVLIGGFPCQPFSTLGKLQGFDDEKRGTLFFEIKDILQKHDTKVVVLENVKNIINHDNGKTFNRILTELDEIGYDCYYHILNSKDYGVPQRRNRMFLVGLNRKYFKEKEFIFPAEQKLEVTTQDLLDEDVPYEYFLTKKISKTILSTGTKNYKAKPTIDQPISKTLTATMHKMHRASQDNYVTDDKNFKKHKTDDNRINVRKLTPNECRKLQGFPDDWQQVVSDAQAYKQFGNAVTVNVAYAVAKDLKEYMDKNKK